MNVRYSDVRLDASCSYFILVPRRRARSLRKWKIEVDNGKPEDGNSIRVSVYSKCYKYSVSNLSSTYLLRTFFLSTHKLPYSGRTFARFSLLLLAAVIDRGRLVFIYVLTILMFKAGILENMPWLCNWSIGRGFLGSFVFLSLILQGISWFTASSNRWKTAKKGINVELFSLLSDLEAIRTLG